ncbi:PAS domain-containing protein [Parafrankia elaeagni]|uniref:PAS domain-containing protein n=1 Tax=Parafrankia elaeagni TaxID=222534 RepID=UPI00037589DC|nr:PAS domain-containing protein [Parafrankia elaeagni]
MTSETRHAQAAGRPWSRGGGAGRAAETSAVHLLDLLSEVVFRTDADGRWIYLNRAWTDLTGYEVGPSLGARFLDYVHPDEAAYASAVFADLARGTTGQCLYETRYRTRDGGYRRVQIRATVLRGPAGEVLGNTGTIVDVSGSRFAVQVVGEHATLLESVTAGRSDELPTGVAVYDRDLRLRRSSGAVERLVDVPLRVGDPLDRLAERARPADWRSRSLSGNWGLVPVALRTGRAQLGDLELVGAGGAGRSLRASVIPYEEGGEELAAVSLCDVTDLRRAERQQAGLARLGQHALAGADLPALLTEAVELVSTTLEVTVCEVIRDAGDAAASGGLARVAEPPASVAPAALGTGPIYLTGPLAIEARSLVHLALDVDEPVVANNLDASPHLRSGWSDAGRAQAALAARVGSSAAPFGVLAAASTMPRRFTADEARFVQAVAHLLGAAADREAAERHARTRHEEAERGRAWLAARAEVTAGAMAAGQQQALMLLASLARGVTSADVGAVALPDEAGNLIATEVDAAPHRHCDPETLHGLALALEAAESRAEFLAGRPVHVDGLDDSDSWSGPIPLPAAHDAPARDDATARDGRTSRDAKTARGGRAARPEADQDGPVDLATAARLREALVIPLTAAERPMGALVLGNSPDATPFAARDTELAGAFAHDAAMAVHLAEVHRDRARAAVVQDRERIARDLHDLVIQRLFAIGLHLQSLSRAVGDVTAARLNAAITGLDSTIDDIRRTIFRLGPTPAGV